MVHSSASDMATALAQAYDPEQFRSMAHRLVDELADYLNAVTQPNVSMPVLPAIHPSVMLDKWPVSFEKGPSASFEELMRLVLAQSNHLHHPRYIGHQVSAPLPVAALCDMVAALLNNGTAIYEMGPASTAMERRVIEWMSRLIGYGVQADGVLTSGGTIGNLTALLAARQVKAGFDIWDEGPGDASPFCVLAAEQTHYSVKRAVQIMGWGHEGVMPVAVDASFKMQPEALVAAYRRAQEKGKKVLAVVANGCSTATGSFDPLSEIADFCQTYDLWLHVDGAHGASTLVSEKYRGLLAGIDRADSVVWDAHKMMMMPGLVTAVIFKDGQHSYEAFSQRASYLFERQAQEEWYNLAHRTMECTKRMLSLKLYVALKVYGTALFDEYITQTYDRTRQFAHILQADPEFEIAIAPESNIICFRYIPQGFAGDLDALQLQIRQRILADESFYIVQTRLPRGQYLRCVLMNPFTSLADLEALMVEIRRVAADLNS